MTTLHHYRAALEEQELIACIAVNQSPQFASMNVRIPVMLTVYSNQK